MTKLKRIRIKPTPAPRGKCPVRPPLDMPHGINPMLWCTFPKGHKGKHSWESA